MNVTLVSAIFSMHKILQMNRLHHPSWMASFEHVQFNKLTIKN